MGIGFVSTHLDYDPRYWFILFWHDKTQECSVTLMVKPDGYGYYFISGLYIIFFFLTSLFSGLEIIEYHKSISLIYLFSGS
jgi:hypothetical protein